MIRFISLLLLIALVSFAEEVSFKNNVEGRAKLLAECLMKGHGEWLLGFEARSIATDLPSIYGDMRENMIMFPMLLRISPFVTFDLNDLDGDNQLRKGRISWVQTKYSDSVTVSSGFRMPYEPLFFAESRICWLLYVEKAPAELDIKDLKIVDSKIEPFETLRNSKPVFKPLDFFKKFGIGDVINESNYFNLRHSVSAISMDVDVSMDSDFLKSLRSDEPIGFVKLTNKKVSNVPVAFVGDMKALISLSKLTKAQKELDLQNILKNCEEVSKKMETDFGRQVLNQMVIFIVENGAMKK